MYEVINFYKFVELENLSALKFAHERVCQELGLLGSVIIAPEGINGSLAATARENLDAYLAFVASDRRFENLRVHFSLGKVRPFTHIHVKIKNYIVVFDMRDNPSVNAIAEGKRLSPEAFKKALEDKDDATVVLDTRNYFEVDYGKFQHAEHLNIERFRDFSQKFLEKYGEAKDKTFLVYCTGGIRCEKVVAFAEKHGFKNVLQLDGGIINYHKQLGSECFEGDNFVFDKRWAITTELEQAPVLPHPDRT